MRALPRHGGDRRALRAFAARRELVEAGLTRRDLVKMGLLTGGGVGGGLLVAEKGMAKDLRSPSALGSLPPLAPFVQPLPILPVLPTRDPATDPGFAQPPTAAPNRGINPATKLPFEGRSEPHQSRGPGQPGAFEPEDFHVTRIGANPHATVHLGLPEQTLWGFNLGDEDLVKDLPLSPGPVVILRHLHGSLIRRYNALPPIQQNGGFGVPEVSTHLHNFHSAPDSDGGPCDPVQQRFFFRGQYYDYFHNMRFAGWNSTDKPDGNIQEYLGFMWYHDHRVDHTAENTYKGLVGPAIVFSAIDTGDESTGLRLPGFAAGGGFDIPLVFGDKLFDPQTGLLAFDTFNTDGIIGNVILVNGKSQPFFEVSKRRYRFRLLDAGPSRSMSSSSRTPTTSPRASRSWSSPRTATCSGGRSRRRASAWPSPSATTSSSTSPASRASSATPSGSSSRTAWSRSTAAARRARSCLPAAATSCSSSASARRSTTAASTTTRCRPRGFRRRPTTRCSGRSCFPTSARRCRGSRGRSASSAATAAGRSMASSWTARGSASPVR
jgi:hypothetical protein